MSGDFTKAKFVRQKTYLEEFYSPKFFKGRSHKFFIKSTKIVRNIKGFDHFKKIGITCAGMPNSCYSHVTWENFKTGFSCNGKLMFKHVKGGVKLVDTEFTIKEEKMKKHVENFNI